MEPLHDVNIKSLKLEMSVRTESLLLDTSDKQLIEVSDKMLTN